MSLYILICYVFFFFKQKTAYEMRISDWSSDVCSSDLVSHDRHMLEMTADRLVLVDHGTAREFDGSLDDYIAQVLAGDSKAEGKKANGKESRRAAAEAREAGKAPRKIGRASCRERVCQYV